MHRAIIAAGLLVTTGIAALRARTKSLYLHDSYEYLVQLPISMEQAFLALLFLYAVLVLLAYRITKRRNIPLEGLAIFVATPALLTSTVLASPALPLAILMAFVVVLWRYPLPQMIVSLIAPVLHPAGFIIAALTLILNTLRNRKITAIVGLAGIVGVLQHTPFLLTLNMSVIELGSLTGISIFFLLLTIAGSFTAWNKKTYSYILMAYPLIVAGIIVPELLITAALPMAALSGHAIYTLRTQEWKLESIRSISIFLIVLGVLFAAASTVNLAVQAEPTEDFTQTLRVLDGLNKRQPVYVTPEHEALLQVHGINATSEHTEQILSTRRFDVAKPYLPRYVLLHTSDNVDNLRFLIENTDNFKTLHTSSYELWEVKP